MWDFDFFSCINFNDHHVIICMTASKAGKTEEENEKKSVGNRLKMSTLNSSPVTPPTIWQSIILKAFFIFMKPKA